MTSLAKDGRKNGGRRLRFYLVVVVYKSREAVDICLLSAVLPEIYYLISMARSREDRSFQLQAAYLMIGEDCT